MLRGAFPQDGCHHVVESLKDVIRRETDHAETGAFQIGVACGILSHSRVMRRTVNLNDEARGVAGEVDDKGTERRLSAKLVAAELVTAQSRPEQ